MRILKYIFLLIVLALIALTVFVATQKGQFDVTQSRIINSPRTVIFNYVNDYRNWENWSSWKTDDADTQFSYPQATSGKGASFTWKGGDSEGRLETIFVKDNDSISQKMIFNGSPSAISWKFKDTVGGTKVTWHAKGRLDFVSKIYAAAKGGAGTIFNEMFEKSLANLDRTLDYEINTYKVIVAGITQKTGVMYLRQTINSKIDKAPKNIQIMLSKMIFFCKKNKVPTAGKPFIIYHTYNSDAGLTRFSICMPIREEIYTSAGSDISFGQLEPFRAVKVTLNGDYSHRSEAWAKAAQFISDNRLERVADFRSLEIFSKGMEEIKSPSKWITDIYIPVRSTAAVPARPASVRPIRAATTTPATVTADPPAIAVPSEE
ncbi:MAG TPA: GyrI-like domain-containing protein [Flavobacterium sp.]|jgi:effector-binding domain-containing protein